MYNIISINIGPILTFGTGPRILSMGEGGANWSRSTACSRRSGQGRWRAPGDAVEGAVIERRRQRSSQGDGVLRGLSNRGRAP
jgi:hypothetical protein